MDQTTLEILKLAVQALTPLVVAYIGWKLSKRLKDLEQNQWSKRTLIQKRIEIYDDISPLLNRLLCYFTYVGDWQKYEPLEIIETKRSLDHKVHVNRFLLEETFFGVYHEFIRTLFEEYNGAGENARLRTHINSPDGDRSAVTPSGTWDTAWNKCFSKNNIADKDVVRKRYYAVMNAQKGGIFS